MEKNYQTANTKFANLSRTKINVKDNKQNFCFIRDSTQKKNYKGENKKKIEYLLGIKSIFKEKKYNQQCIINIKIK